MPPTRSSSAGRKPRVDLVTQILEQTLSTEATREADLPQARTVAKQRPAG